MLFLVIIPIPLGFFLNSSAKLLNFKLLSKSFPHISHDFSQVLNELLLGVRTWVRSWLAVGEESKPHLTHSKRPSA